MAKDMSGVDRREMLRLGLFGAGALLMPASLRAQSPQPGPPTPGVEQARTPPPAAAPDIEGKISPTARGKALLVVNKLSLTLGFYDPASGVRQASFSLPSRPHELLVSRDGAHAYVSIYGDGIYGANPHPGNQVAVIDLAARQCSGFLSTGEIWAPHGLTEGPDGTIWATCDIGQTVVGFDPATRRQVATIQVGHKGAHWISAPDPRGLAFLSNRSGAGIVVVDLVCRKVVGHIATPHAITGIALSRDGRTLFASDDQQPALLRIDTRSGEVASTALRDLPFSVAEHGDRERRVLASPDGRYVFVSDYPSAAVVRVDAADPRSQRLLIVEHGPMGLAISRDSETLWVCNHDAGTITVVDVATMNALRDFRVGEGPETAAILG